MLHRINSVKLDKTKIDVSIDLMCTKFTVKRLRNCKQHFQLKDMEHNDDTKDYKIKLYNTYNFPNDEGVTYFFFFVFFVEIEEKFKP
jgi:hypothetical protein